MWQAPERDAAVPLSLALLAVDDARFTSAVPSLVHDIAVNLAAAGHAVRVFMPAAAQRKGEEARRVEAGPPEEPCAYHVHAVAFDGEGDEAHRLVNLNNALAYFVASHEAVAGPFDAIHAFEWTTVGALLQLQSQGRRTVLTCTSLYPPTDVEGEGARRRRVEAAGLAAADLIVLPSTALASQAEARGAPPYRVRVMGVRAPPPSPRLASALSGSPPPPLDGAEAKPPGGSPAKRGTKEDAGSLKAELGFGVMDPMVLYVGALDDWGGADLLLEAFPAVLQARGDARLVIAGDGPLREDLAARAARLPHAIRLIPEADPARVAALSRACDARCVPARAPSQSPLGGWALDCAKAVRDAWADAKPVVMSDEAAEAVAALAGPGILAGRAGGPVADAAGLAAALLRLFGDFAAARAAGARGHARISGSAPAPAAAAETCARAYEELAACAGAECG